MTRNSMKQVPQEDECTRIDTACCPSEAFLRSIRSTVHLQHLSSDPKAISVHAFMCTKAETLYHYWPNRCQIENYYEFKYTGDSGSTPSCKTTNLHDDEETHGICYAHILGMCNKAVNGVDKKKGQARCRYLHTKLSDCPDGIIEEATLWKKEIMQTYRLAKAEKAIALLRDELSETQLELKTRRTKVKQSCAAKSNKHEKIMKTA